MRQKVDWGARLQRALLILLSLCVLSYLGYDALLYHQARKALLPGTTIGAVDVSGFDKEEAARAVAQRYSSTVIVHHRDEEAQIAPAEIDFTLDLTAMVEAAFARQTELPFWQGYLDRLLRRPLRPEPVPLIASHDTTKLAQRLETIAGFLDKPARPPVPQGESLVFEAGAAGYVTDVAASIPAVEAAFYRPSEREANLTIIDQAEEPMDMSMLQRAIENMLLDFSGVGSIFVMDLESGEEMSINGDVAVSGLSIIKIAILLETYRAIDGVPTLDQRKLISETAIVSGDFSANLLLDVVAGRDNAYLGADILTESMQRLGLDNTFIAVPYEEPARPGRATYVTEANSRDDIDTEPDPAMQTTAEDMGSLLAMIYACANGGGPLLAVYPDQITPGECRQMLDFMQDNVEGRLILAGVPEGVPVAHKHGWAGSTHGDAGIVFSPGGDYVLVEYLDGPGDWLVADISFPILRRIARVTYNFFNQESPFVEPGETANQ